MHRSEDDDYVPALLVSVIPVERRNGGALLSKLVICAMCVGMFISSGFDVFCYLGAYLPQRSSSTVYLLQMMLMHTIAAPAFAWIDSLFSATLILIVCRPRVINGALVILIDATVALAKWSCSEVAQSDSRLH